jgi:hypothetical protein
MPPYHSMMSVGGWNCWVNRGVNNEVTTKKIFAIFLDALGRSDPGLSKLGRYFKKGIFPGPPPKKKLNRLSQSRQALVIPRWTTSTKIYQSTTICRQARTTDIAVLYDTLPQSERDSRMSLTLKKTTTLFPNSLTIPSQAKFEPDAN